jgi:hypothetical protein
MTCLLGYLGSCLFEEGKKDGVCVVAKVRDEVSETVIGRETRSNIYLLYSEMLVLYMRYPLLMTIARGL